MAVATASDKILSSNAIQLYDFDPNGTAAVDIAWVDMRDFQNFACVFARTIGTGAVTFAILGNTASDGSGTDVTIKTHPVTFEPDMLMEQIWLECTADELASFGADYRYVSASVSVATATDEGVVGYVRAGPKFAQSGLTADIVS